MNESRDYTDMIQKGREDLVQVSQILKSLRDDDITALLGDGAMDMFLRALLDVEETDRYLNIQEFLLANKKRVYAVA